MRQWQSTSILIAAIAAGTGPSRDVGASEPSSAISLGYPNAGRLVDGRQFRPTPYMVTVPSHADSKVRWALPGLLSVLDRASRIVARKFPGSVLEIGELSRRQGGPIASHLSHQNGRDADVGFYLIDPDDEPVHADTFLRCYGSGDGRDDPTVRFDEKRNWAFVRAVLEDPHFEVRQIFIYAPLRARLLAYAATINAPRELRVKAAAAMMQPVNALPHDDHFHIRISCPADQIDEGCADLPLWRAPGSPDEFGPDLLAESPRIRVPRNAFPPEDWGAISKLWSIERSVCDRNGLACTDDDESLSCEDLGPFGSPWIVPSLDEGRVATAPPPSALDFDGAPVPWKGVLAETPKAKLQSFLEALRPGESRTTTGGAGLWVGPAQEALSVIGKRPWIAGERELVLDLDELAPPKTLTAQAATVIERSSTPETSDSGWGPVSDAPLN